MYIYKYINCSEHEMYTLLCYVFARIQTSRFSEIETQRYVTPSNIVLISRCILYYTMEDYQFNTPFGFLIRLTWRNSQYKNINCKIEIIVHYNPIYLNYFIHKRIICRSNILYKSAYWETSSLWLMIYSFGSWYVCVCEANCKYLHHTHTHISWPEWIYHEPQT